MTTEGSTENEEYVTRPRDRRQQRRRKGIDDGSKESTTTIEATEEEYELKDYINDNGCVGRG